MPMAANPSFPENDRSFPKATVWHSQVLEQLVVHLVLEGFQGSAKA